METIENTPAAPKNARLTAKTSPALPLAPLLQALGDIIRWRILEELEKSPEPLMVVDIARALRLPATNISKHLALLRKSGIARQGRGRLYGIPPEFRTPGERTIRLGAITLHFGQTEET